MLILQNISYIHPNGDLLFKNINLTVNKNEKIALIGNNGSGKSTLLKIIAGNIAAISGSRTIISEPYYVAQLFGQFNHLSVAEALKVEAKIKALHAILNGTISDENYSLLNDDWTIEERCREALDFWKLDHVDLFEKMENLSGGEKMKVFLAGIRIHKPEFILLDEPSNHLDAQSREILYKFIEQTKQTLIIVSHDRKLLNKLNIVIELNSKEAKTYGGNYDFYQIQKENELNALYQDIQHKQKVLKKAKEKERETIERQQKLDSKGKGKKEKAGVARIMMNTLKNKAENSTSKLKSVHSEKINSVSQELHHLQSSTANFSKMKADFDSSLLHKGKILFRATKINFTYNNEFIWKEELNFQIISGERIALKGKNGAGKTTLIKLILAELEPNTGELYRAANNTIYIDQDYSLIQNELTIYEQIQLFNTDALQEHEVKTKLNRFLFSKEDWAKPCSSLSGGEKMRLLICCLTTPKEAPDMIILDEPTNNLDIQNVQILTQAIKEYAGTIIAVSHDELFLEEIGVDRTIEFS